MELPIKVTYPKGAFGSEIEQHFQFEIADTSKYPNVIEEQICDTVFHMMNRVGRSPIEELLGTVVSRSYREETGQHAFSILLTNNKKKLTKGRNLYTNITKHVIDEKSYNMKLPIKVTYPKGSFGSEIEQHFQFKIDVPGILEYPDVSEEQICDTVFRMMNRVDGSPIEYLLDQFACRSMSVGDLITIGNNTYRCEMIGWVILS